MNKEATRLNEEKSGTRPWKKWGPYLSERQWGTVREDMSLSGDAWNHFTHDQARSRAYQWGEDGMAGLSDDQQILCFSIALWNGNDPIIKERLFGLTNAEGNHGEDVKEYYFYLDNTPTHSYMRYLYKYPQRTYPYERLITNNRLAGRQGFEYELIDTGVFEGDRYFDVFVEYAKHSPEAILVNLTIHNRGPDEAHLDVLPHLWFRQQARWQEISGRPQIEEISRSEDGMLIRAIDPILGEYVLWGEGARESLFVENETNEERLWGRPNRYPFVKDGINDYIVCNKAEAVNAQKAGTKAALHYSLDIPSGANRSIRLILAGQSQDLKPIPELMQAFDSIFHARTTEADTFYRDLTPDKLSADEALVMRQALAGMLWSKQFYFYDVDRWLELREKTLSESSSRLMSRNRNWHHMYNGDVLSMPDKWEYPWYAAWDLAFHVIALTLVDPQFGKDQLNLILQERYIHPNGQIPAYEWNFGDVNPPVQAWSTIFTYRLESAQTGRGDLEWLKISFHKLLLNFTWWVNRKDLQDRNVFEGGFLGLDNIGVFDRNQRLPDGTRLEQADGTAWMALFCQNMLEISVELATHDDAYTDMVLKFTEHFLWIAGAITDVSDGTGMWDEADGFFYDMLRLPDGTSQRLKVRSIVGLLPFCAATVFEGEIIARHPKLWEQFQWFLDSRPELLATIHDPRIQGEGGRRLASIMDEHKLRRVLTRMLDEDEFLSPFGIRSLSRHHADHPYAVQLGKEEYRIGYLPAESDSGMFGGNSNWRGPVWMPINALIIRALVQYYGYYGENFKIECPSGSGTMMSLYEVAEEISHRLAKIFLKNAEGKRPVFGGAEKFQTDPYWKDYLLFYEYFHGDNGAGIGASHQTGWTGLIARTLHLFGTMTPEIMLAGGKKAYSEQSSTQLKRGQVI
ncbi:MAG: hypothetical protein RL333_746 [Pseudomonadota bacterium]|jgi:hypothetical protein